MFLNIAFLGGLVFARFFFNGGNEGAVKHDANGAGGTKFESEDTDATIEVTVAEAAVIARVVEGSAAIDEDTTALDKDTTTFNGDSTAVDKEITLADGSTSVDGVTAFNDAIVDEATLVDRGRATDDRAIVVVGDTLLGTTEAIGDTVVVPLKSSSQRPLKTSELL